MPRGYQGPVLYVTEGDSGNGAETATATDDSGESADNSRRTSASGADRASKGECELYSFSQAGVSHKAAEAKVCSQCWHCGQGGHSRRVSRVCVTTRER